MNKTDAVSWSSVGGIIVVVVTVSVIACMVLFASTIRKW